MRNAVRVAILGVAAAAAITTLSLAIVSTGAQQPAPQNYRAPHMADGHPDLNGIWQAFVTANWDLQDHEAQAGPHPEIMGAYGGGPAGQSIVEGGEIPYKPAALARKKDNFDKRALTDVSKDKQWHAVGDPELKCYMP